MTTPILNEQAVLALMRVEHDKLAAQEKELYAKFRAAEDALKPAQEAVEQLRKAWVDVYSPMQSLATILKAKQPDPDAMHADPGAVAMLEGKCEPAQESA